LYEAHFGLSARPFAETVSLAGYVALPSRESALRRLRFGLEHGQGPALLFGPPGTGKTLLARRLARGMGGRCAHLTFPAMPAAELLAMLVDELGGGANASGPAPPLSASVRKLKALLTSAALRGQRPLLIVDEAHLIVDPDTFEALRLALNFASAGPPDLALLLVGGPEVLLHLSSGLADRLTARSLLSALDEPESIAYVEGRLAAAGAKEPLFAPEALAALHSASEGLPRRLNRLADLALLIAYAQRRTRPDASTVAIAARELDIEPQAA
jgi:type II secretory pathway predicted ATPase ExeA